MDNLTYKIRPSARIIHTIGSDLIGDPYAALVELVKNSFDADADRVNIEFKYTTINDNKAIVITIEDNGHGMPFDTVINNWLVPATNDKLKRRVSKSKNRILQGRKGIGRFAAAILGQEMTLVTIDESGTKTSAVIDWRAFNTDKYLEDIDLLIEKEETKSSSGTEIIIIATDESIEEIIIDEKGEEIISEKIESKFSYWDNQTIDKLINELRKLISPFDESIEDLFEINLSFINSPFEEIEQNIVIDTYPIIEYYDYRISGEITDNGTVDILFENNVNPQAVQSEKILKKLFLTGNNKYCGNIKIDFRVFDREPEAIDNLINKGLINPVSKKYMGKNEARRLLNEVYGVNIYKNSFRIRPYGNQGVDWLDLDKNRIQNPSLKIGNNQIVGFVTIESEEVSNLEEKSARDGLKENEHFFGLKELTQKVIFELETRRYAYRVKSEKSRGKKNSIQESINTLFSLDEFRDTVVNKLADFNVSKNAIDEINIIISQEEIKKSSIKEEIEKTIAIYQGQATLGKIVNFILHEGRKPLQFFNSETRVMRRYLDSFYKTKNEEHLKELTNSITGFRKNTNVISDLFKRIDPLAKQRRSNKANFNIKKVIEESVNVFKLSLEESNIEFNISDNETLEIFGWDQDLYIAITNLIENSVYWLEKSTEKVKGIVIEIYKNEEHVIIEYKDTGPGLTDLEIESDVIFEPGYSKKSNGTGIGLAIAGEAINRLNGKLKALKSDNGVHFIMEFIK